MARLPIFVALCLAASASNLWALQGKPSAPPKGTRKTSDGPPDSPRGGFNCYCCNTGWKATRVRWYESTFSLEYSGVCDALCASCPPDHCRTGHQKRRDSGEGDHSRDVTVAGALDYLSKQMKDGGVGAGILEKAGAALEQELKGKFGASGQVTLGSKTTHASECERLDFYGYVSVTVVWCEQDAVFTWNDIEIDSATDVFLSSVAVTVANGYDKKPCSCPVTTDTKHGHVPGTKGTYAVAAPLTVTPGPKNVVGSPTTATVTVTPQEKAPDSAVPVEVPILTGIAAGVPVLAKFLFQGSGGGSDHSAVTPLGEAGKQIYPDLPVGTSCEVPRGLRPADTFLYNEYTSGGRKLASEADPILSDPATGRTSYVQLKASGEMAEARKIETTQMDSNLKPLQSATTWNASLRVAVTPPLLQQGMEGVVRAWTDAPEGIEPDARYRVELNVEGVGGADPGIAFVPGPDEGTTATTAPTCKIFNLPGAEFRRGVEGRVRAGRTGQYRILARYSRMGE